MNAKQLFAAATLAAIGTGAFAQEATQFPIEHGVLTRAEVQAELARARAAGEVLIAGEHYGSFPAMSVVARQASFDSEIAARSRADVRTEARAAARTQHFNELYVGG